MVQEAKVQRKIRLRSIGYSTHRYQIEGDTASAL